MTASIINIMLFISVFNVFGVVQFKSVKILKYLELNFVNIHKTVKERTCGLKKRKANS